MPSGSSGFLVSVGPGVTEGVAPGVGVTEGDGLVVAGGSVAPALGSVVASSSVALADGLAPGAGSFSSSGPGVALALCDGSGVGDGDAAGFSDSAGSSDRVTHGPGAKGMSFSSATASLGVIPRPTRTAVGMAARAIALPAGA
jgi:hypothetical protein